MTAEAQLDWVEVLRALPRDAAHLADLYMAILWPAAIGKPDGFVLFDKADPTTRPATARTPGSTLNHNGLCTKAEAAPRCWPSRPKGLRPLNVG
jgi:hypothetical protein